MCELSDPTAEQLQLFKKRHEGKTCSGVCSTLVEHAQALWFSEAKSDELFCPPCILLDPKAYPQEWVTLAKADVKDK